MLQSRPHYPFVTRLLIDLFNAGELTRVTEVELELDYGYVGRLIYHDGAVRFFKGAELGVNSSVAASMVRDKGYTRYFLNKFGFRAPRGTVFLTPLFFRRRKTRLQESGSPSPQLADVPDYVEHEIGYPCYVKPNEGSQGHDVHRCDDRDALDRTLDFFRTAEYETITVEAAVHLPEYRVVVYRDEVICCYGRYPLHVTGDGQSSIRELLLATEAHYTQAGRPPTIEINDHRIHDKLVKVGYSLDTILDTGQVLQMFDSANLSIGGTAQDVTDQMHPDWMTFAVDVVRQFDLAICGLDLCCADISQPGSEYAILELNGTPTLANYATLGEREYAVVRSLYRRILNREDEA